MKKEIMLRGIIGFFVGVTIGQLIPMISSFLDGSGEFYPVVPTLAEICGNEINAVSLQFVMCGILGVCFGSGSLIWENDNWSIFKQTVLHFLLSSIVMFPTAYTMQWVEHSIKGIASYVGIFVGIYVIIWFFFYVTWWGRIWRLNHKIKEKL